MKNNKSTSVISTVFGNKVLATGIQERIVSLVGRKGEWAGTMTELTRSLRTVSGKTKITLPTSPSVMRKVVNNVVYGLRRSGVSVNFTRTTDHMRKRVVEFVQR